jgi:hypothetical protein
MSRAYFDSVYQASKEFIEGLQLPRDPTPLDSLLKVWRPMIEAQRTAFVAQLSRSRPQLHGRAAPTAGPAGMNTVGMLCDRLTVVAMKEWVLRSRLGKPADADRLRDSQIRELIDTLGEIRPGHSSFTQKVTALKFQAEASSWEDAYFGLLATNVLLWEAQEVLYAGKVQDLPSEEIRRYIAWFSEGNILRNEYISCCETMYWALVEKTW